MPKTSSNPGIRRTSLHFGWDRGLAPALTVAPGEVVEFDAMDAGGGQITPDSGVGDVTRFDFSKVNPVFGPVCVDGAEPGDALKVTILDLTTEGWGWTANIPGFGLLADVYDQPALHIWRFDPRTATEAVFGPGGGRARVPLKPFPGIMGCCPAADGVQSVVNPRRVGGNMDTRDLSVGSELYLPVEVAGALFSCGDGHAAQGDGEICGTAIEAPMRMTLRLDLVKDAKLRFPRFTTPGPVTRHWDARGYEVCMGVGPDLMQAAHEAALDMVRLVAARLQISELDAYMLCSVCADLRISEVVDMPNWIVSCYVPRVVLG